MSAEQTSGDIPAQPVAEHFSSGVEEEIRLRAYELYQARGQQQGFDREDWAQAEAEILSRLQNQGRASG